MSTLSTLEKQQPFWASVQRPRKIGREKGEFQDILQEMLSEIAGSSSSLNWTHGCALR